jgi:hypothetical protein
MLDVVSGKKIEIINAGWYRQDVVFNGKRRVGFITWRVTSDNKSYCTTLHPDSCTGCTGARLEWLLKTDANWLSLRERKSELGEDGTDTTKSLLAGSVSDVSNTSGDPNVR